jgi:2-polyprenyl-6-methoxyphenol hydroxylase-like FAD-dependent oxidoreductase
MSVLATSAFDVAIIGAGVAGTSAASALSLAGLSVALIDFRDQHPPDFRAEKIGERQVAFFDAFGLGPAARRQLTAFDGVWVHRFGRIVERNAKREYSSPYGDLVNALRKALPPQVEMIVGRVAHVRTSIDRQEIEFGDGRTLSARLLIVATGYGENIRNQLGMRTRMISPKHSLGIGFDLDNPISAYPFASLVWITERPADQAAAITLFPMADRMRANLFLYRPPDDPWSMAFRRDPAAGLLELFPQFARTFPAMKVSGHVAVRPMDLMQVENYRQAGVVLIGDSFLTTCPVSGTGIDKALNDVDRLRRIAPSWFATTGMAAEKVGQFYDDPVKRSVDAAGLRLSLRERAIRMDHGPVAFARRLRRNVLRRGAYRVRDVLATFHVSPAIGG